MISLKDILGLFLADNAGETIFDLILIEQISQLPNKPEIFYAVKDKPIINDALKEDALICGIDKVAQGSCNSSIPLLSSRTSQTQGWWFRHRCRSNQ